MFDLADYAGAIITDLFGDAAYFQDPDEFWTHQNKAVALAIGEWKAGGWNEVVVMERGETFCTWEHGKREREQGGKIFLAIGHDGTVKPHIGYLSNADIKKIDAILKIGGDADGKDKTSKPEMSGPLSDYVALHRYAAIRASLLEHPSVALHLTVTHMLVGSDLWTVGPQSTKSRKESTTQSVAASKGAALFAAEHNAVYDLLGNPL